MTNILIVLAIIVGWGALIVLLVHIPFNDDKDE